MKKLLISLLVIVVVLIGGLFLAVQFAPIDKIQQEAIAQVKAQTGRDLSFTDAKIEFWPSIGVSLKDAKLSNADWSAQKTMVSLSAADVHLAVLPLLHKEVEISKIVLKDPVINLEVAADGRKNWEFKSAGAGDGKAGATGGDKSSAGGVPEGMGLKFGGFEISGGSVSFNDKQKGTAIAISDIAVTATFPDLSSALDIDGSATYKQKSLTLKAALDKPVDFANGKPSAGHLVVKTDDASADITGVFATSGTMLANGAIKADISSLAKLVAWLGDGKQGKLPFEKISFSAKADADASNFKLQDAALTLDDIAAKGDVGLGFGGAKPSLFARLSVNKLNLDRFTNTAQGKDANASTAPTEKADDNWDATPIDFTPLKSLDADVVLKTDGFSIKGADVGPSTLTITLKDGDMHFTSSEATLFQGKFSSDVTLNAAPATPTMAFKFDMSGVQAQPMLTAFAGFKKLSGTTDAKIDVTSSGNSQKTIVGNLNGSGSAVFKNGALTGIDLVNIAQLVQKGLGNMNVGDGKTDFVELGGTFKITNGVAHNDDLKMKGPLLQVSGAGDVDLPKKYVTYRVTPVLTASSATDNAKGLSIPVNIAGPFSNIKIKPDLKGAIQGVLGDPKAARDALKNAVGSPDIKAGLKDVKKDPGAAINNLLSGKGLFAKKPAADAAAPAAAPAPAQ